MQFPNASKEGGQGIILSPDVCYIPAPPPPPAGPGGIPTPFPNIGNLTGADKTTDKVLIRNKESLVEGSLVPSSTGDEPGCSTIVPPGQKGLASMKNMEKVEFAKHSSKVKFDGKGVITHTSPTKHNSTNTAGNHSVPSQTVVLSA
jgi:hypothetical protein